MFKPLSSLPQGESAFIAAPAYGALPEAEALAVLRLREGLPITFVKPLPPALYNVRGQNGAPRLGLKEACLLHGRFAGQARPEPLRSQFALAALGEEFILEHDSSGLSLAQNGTFLQLASLAPAPLEEDGLLLFSPAPEAHAKERICAVPRSLASLLRVRACPACWACGACQVEADPGPG